MGSIAAKDATPIVGSPIYMAPENLRGEPASKSSDIYAIGVLFYELLFGFCPYED